MNTKSKIAILIVSMILGIILAIQFNTVKSIVGPGYLPVQRSKELAVELNNLQKEKENLLNELENLEKKVKQYESSASKENVYIEELSKELQKYRMFAGYERVQGEGIVLNIDDPKREIVYGDETSTIVENYDYLLQIISYLNVSGAEAISINGLRYTNYTEFLLAGNHLNINGVPISAPIEIKAIGPPEDMENALRLKGGVLDILKYGFEMQISLTQKKNIIIPRYTKIQEFRYAKPVENING